MAGVGEAGGSQVFSNKAINYTSAEAATRVWAARSAMPMLYLSRCLCSVCDALEQANAETRGFCNTGEAIFIYFA